MRERHVEWLPFAHPLGSRGSSPDRESHCQAFRAQNDAQRCCTSQGASHMLTPQNESHSNSTYEGFLVLFTMLK